MGASKLASLSTRCLFLIVGLTDCFKLQPWLSQHGGLKPGFVSTYTLLPQVALLEYCILARGKEAETATNTYVILTVVILETENQRVAT